MASVRKTVVRETNWKEKFNFGKERGREERK